MPITTQKNPLLLNASYTLTKMQINVGKRQKNTNSQLHSIYTQVNPNKSNKKSSK